MSDPTAIWLEAQCAALREALQANMGWIGPPPTGPADFDSAREGAWREGQAALSGDAGRALYDQLRTQKALIVWIQGQLTVLANAARAVRLDPRDDVAPHHDCPPCPQCGSPSVTSDEAQRECPATMLMCCACGHPWEPTMEDMARARRADAAWRARR